MKNSKIQWTDHTFNPWIGCTKVSPGCSNCYAETLMDTRWGKVEWGKGKPRVRTSGQNWHQVVLWNEQAARSGIRKRVFCASLADVFDDEVELGWLFDLFTMIYRTRYLDWLVLTKRPENVISRMMEISTTIPIHVWLGISVEDQARVRERVPILANIPARVKFLSCEPLLEIVDLSSALSHVDWVICGGESGPNARPMEIDWALDLRRQCKEAGVPFFMKQLGGRRAKRDKIEDFPEELRVREFPT